MNKGMISKVIDVFIELINYIVISFALVSVAMSLREHSMGKYNFVYRACLFRWICKRYTSAIQFIVY